MNKNKEDLTRTGAWSIFVWCVSLLFSSNFVKVSALRKDFTEVFCRETENIFLPFSLFIWALSLKNQSKAPLAHQLELAVCGSPNNELFDLLHKFSFVRSSRQPATNDSLSVNKQLPSGESLHLILNLPQNCVICPGRSSPWFYGLASSAVLIQVQTHMWGGELVSLNSCSTEQGLTFAVGCRCR